MDIVEMTESDFEEFWPTFKSIVGAQDTYAFDPEMSFEEGVGLWLNAPMATYVAKENKILGSYYLRKNAAGPGSHIANCGYMVAPSARGKGVATKLCLHSQEQARKLGFMAMQFNTVVSTNEVAVKLWEKLGYKIIGTVPKAYQHGRLGFVDAHIMHKFL